MFVRAFEPVNDVEYESIAFCEIFIVERGRSVKIDILDVLLGEW